MTEYRLGDLIDDYCPRCRLLLNHRVASLVGHEVAKVICQTCHGEHPYRRGEGGKKKKPASARNALFGQVLAKVQSAPAPQASPSADPAQAADPKSKRKRSDILTRYISRHKTKPPGKGQ